MPVNSTDAPPDLTVYLQNSSARHAHVCPRQVLGVRMALFAARVLGLSVPREDKRLLVIAETDGCFLSGVEAVTRSSPNRRTLRIVDYGKVAATFVDVQSGAAFRFAPQVTARATARQYAPEGVSRYDAMLLGYQRMPDDELLCVRKVRLKQSLAAIISQAGVRVQCVRCQEEIMNERHVMQDGLVYCRACAGDDYLLACE